MRPADLAVFVAALRSGKGLVCATKRAKGWVRRFSQLFPVMLRAPCRPPLWMLPADLRALCALARSRCTCLERSAVRSVVELDVPPCP